MAKNFASRSQHEFDTLANKVKASTAGEAVHLVSAEKLTPNPFQPRTTYQDRELLELAESIREFGILEPLVARMEAGGTYQLVAGHRRWAAARKIGLTEVPVVVRHVRDDEMLVLALVENIQRQDLHPVDETLAYRELVTLCGSQEKAAQRISKNRSTLANSLRLLNLGDDLLAQCRELADVSQATLLKILRIPEALRPQAVQKLKATQTLTPAGPQPAGERKKTGRFVVSHRFDRKSSPFKVEVRYRKTNPAPSEVEQALLYALYSLEGKPEDRPKQGFAEFVRAFETFRKNLAD
ncbi:MAG: ParB/RepB/Spo0J family partition protein [Blastocatellia bacterium]|nr:ParB/RepB/Spo0J family partition protein [Blastocatellia bacterium]